MATSFIEKTRRAILKNSRRNVSAGPGGTIGIPMDRDGGLIDEIVLKCRLSATFTVDPTAFDVRQMIERVNLRSNTGDLVKSLSGQQLFDMARLTEDAATPVATLGGGGAPGAVSTFDFSVEIHHELDGAYFDSVGSLKTVDMSKLDLEVIVATQAKLAGSAFTGETFHAVPAITLSIDPELYVRPEMAYREDVGTQDHFLTSREDANTVTGIRTIELDPSNMTRFVGLHVDNIAGGVDVSIPSDTIIGTVKLVQGGRILADTDFRAMRFATQQKRGLSVVGFAVLDWGDQNGAFCELTAAPVQLQYEVLAGSPAWRVQVTQDYVKQRAVL